MSDRAGFGHGAVDLSSVGVSGASPQQNPGLNEQGMQAEPQASDSAGPVISAPLITEVTEQTFEEVMGLSMTVPVVLVLYTPESLTSKQAVSVMEDVARRSEGAFQLGRINVETNPTVAAAFQVQAVPAGVAVVARRPVPLFEGVPTQTQVEGILTELLQVAPQLGVVGRLSITEDQLEKPTPEEHLPARDAEDRGDWESAIAAWKRVLANDPADQEAKTALVRAQFQLRQENEGTSGEDSGIGQRADDLFASGQESAAFDLLLTAVSETTDGDQREDLRKRIVELFQIGSDKDAVRKARGRLATILMV